MNGRPELIPATIAGAFAFGMVLALLGSIKLPLAERLKIDETRIGGLLSALNLALIPMMVLSGILNDWLGVKWVLAIGSLATATGLFLLSMGRSYKAVLGELMLAGGAGACVSTAASLLMQHAFWPNNAAASNNLGNVFFGLGALVTPALVSLLVQRIGFQRCVALLSLCCLAPAVAAAFTPRDAFPAYEAGSLADLRWPPVLMCGLVLLLYLPLEQAVGTWATTYLTDLRFTPRKAAWLLSGFWLTYLLARLAAAYGLEAYALHRGNHRIGWEPWFILILALLAAIALGHLAGAHHRWNAGWGILFVGAVFGPIFPTLVGYLFNQVDPGLRGTAFGAMFSIGAVGGFVIPPIVGAAARQTSVQRALLILMVEALLLAGAALALGLIR